MDFVFIGALWKIRSSRRETTMGSLFSRSALASCRTNCRGTGGYENRDRLDHHRSDVVAIVHRMMDGSAGRPKSCTSLAPPRPPIHSDREIPRAVRYRAPHKGNA